jgi:DNA polymerase I-like protein with 3'-5' exonuclease and polymerase domains
VLTPETSTTYAAAWAQALVTRLAKDLDQEELAILRAQAADLQNTATPAKTNDPTAPQIVRDSHALGKVAATLSQAPAVAIDLETSGLDPRAGEIVGVGLATETLVVYVPTGHRLDQGGQLLPDQLPIREVVATLGLEKLPLVAHNSKFEFKWLRRHAGIKLHIFWDTMLGAALLHSDLPCGLKETVVRELDVPDWSLPQADMERIAFLPLERVARYCGKDVYYTLELYRRQQACLD